MTTNKDLETYLDWINEFYSEDFLQTMGKEFDMKPNKISNNLYQFDIKSDPGFKETKMETKKKEPKP